MPSYTRLAATESSAFSDCLSKLNGSMSNPVGFPHLHEASIQYSLLPLHILREFCSTLSS